MVTAGYSRHSPWSFGSKCFKPSFFLRTLQQSLNGRQNIIEGDVKAGSKIVVIEDLIPPETAHFDVVQILRDAGMKF